MIDDRRRGTEGTLFTKEQLLNMSANEVAEATTKAAESIHSCMSVTLVHGIVKSINSAVHGSVKSSLDYSKRERAIRSVLEVLLSIESYLTVRRRLVPAVTYAIHNHSAISEGRKSKVLKQWREVVGVLDSHVI